MSGLSLQENWKFKDVKENIEALVSEFEGLLSPFSYFELNKRIEKVHQLKKQIFNYNNIQYWERERLWETLNGDYEIIKFKNIGENKNKKTNEVIL